MSDLTNQTNKTSDMSAKNLDQKLLSQKNLYDIEGNYSEEEYRQLAELLTKDLTDYKEGEIVKGTIVEVQGDRVIIDIGFKAEGSVPVSEFDDPSQIVPGQQVEVLLEKVEGTAEGEVVLSKKLADFQRIWERVLEANEKQEVIQAKILKRIKGGLVAEIFGMEAFLPGSQIDIKPIRDFDAFIGKTLDVKIVKLNHAQKNVVVSHKVLIEEEIKDQREAILIVLKRSSSSRNC